MPLPCGSIHQGESSAVVRPCLRTPRSHGDCLESARSSRQTNSSRPSKLDAFLSKTLQADGVSAIGTRNLRLLRLHLWPGQQDRQGGRSKNRSDRTSGEHLDPGRNEGAVQPWRSKETHHDLSRPGPPRSGPPDCPLPTTSAAPAGTEPGFLYVAEVSDVIPGGSESAAPGTIGHVLRTGSNDNRLCAQPFSGGQLDLKVTVVISDNGDHFNAGPQRQLMLFNEALEIVRKVSSAFEAFSVLRRERQPRKLCQAINSVEHERVPALGQPGRTRPVLLQDDMLYTKLFEVVTGCEAGLTGPEYDRINHLSPVQLSNRRLNPTASTALPCCRLLDVPCPMRHRTLAP